MKTNTSWKRLMSVIGLGVALSGVPAYPTGNEASAASPAVSAAPQTEASDAVTEWNLHAVSFTLTATPPLSPVQQTRVMAIIQLAVHDAVNGITGKYATYLSPSAAPEGASPDAAAIAASHHALSSLFASHASTLDTLFMESLAAHGLSEDDPGIEYGRSAAAAILALRANDNSGQAQFEYDAPGAGTPGVWVRLNNAPALLPGWGAVTPFVLRSGSQFRPPRPRSTASSTRGITTRSNR